MGFFEAANLRVIRQAEDTFIQEPSRQVPATLHRLGPPVMDKYGNPVRGPTIDTAVTLYWFNQTSGSERTGAQGVPDRQIMAYDAQAGVPPSLNVQKTDELSVGGRRYRVRGITEIARPSDPNSDYYLRLDLEAVSPGGGV